VAPGGDAVVEVRRREDLVADGGTQSTVHEAIELFGDAVELLGCRHVPSTVPVAGVVVCSAGPFDAAVDAGRTARLGRWLARRGLAVQRYRPAGELAADDDRARLDFASLVADARRAAELLSDRCGVARVGFLGARLGALVAARVVRQLDGAPLALWEPVIDPASAAAGAAQARHEHELARSATVTSAGTGPRFDVFDTPLGAELADGTRVGDLVDEVGDRPRPLLVVQTGPGDALRPDYMSLVARCRGRHLTVDEACHPCDGRRDGRPAPVAHADALLEHTAAWLAAQLVRPAA
jgi:hypothetical protein